MQAVRRCISASHGLCRRGRCEGCQYSSATTGTPATLARPAAASEVFSTVICLRVFISREAQGGKYRHLNSQRPWMSRGGAGQPFQFPRGPVRQAERQPEFRAAQPQGVIQPQSLGGNAGEVASSAGGNFGARAQSHWRGPQIHLHDRIHTHMLAEGVGQLRGEPKRFSEAERP